MLQSRLVVRHSLFTYTKCLRRQGRLNYRESDLYSVWSARNSNGYLTSLSTSSIPSTSGGYVLPGKYPQHLFYNAEQQHAAALFHTHHDHQALSNVLQYSNGYDVSSTSASNIRIQQNNLDGQHTQSSQGLKNAGRTELKEYDIVFSLDVPEGKCVALRLSDPHKAKSSATSLHPDQIHSNPNHWLRGILHPEEIRYGCELPSESARISFFMGRLAMRTALAQANGNITTKDAWEYEDGIGGFTQLPIVTNLDQSILKDEHGRPQVPQGFIGSISHKATTGVALIAPLPVCHDNNDGHVSPKIGIGVDIEQAFSRRRNIAKKILTPNELNDLGKLKGITRDEEVLLRFR